MKIVADSAMPLVAELFSSFGEVITLPGREIRAADVADADVLLVRSVTLVGQRLLGNSPIRFVGSATSGVDHVDLGCLSARGIVFANAPGCNAQAVVEYVLSVLCGCRPGWRGESFGIIGCGSVGRRLYQCLRALSVHCRVYDPLLPAEGNPDLVAFDEVLQADILCLHTPLTVNGTHPTFHLLDSFALPRLRRGAMLINAGRGAVVDNRALLERLRSGADLQVVLDVWEAEPAIDVELLNLVALGTPHVAGYSHEGRLKGTLMVHDAFCRWLGVSPITVGVAEARQSLVPGPVAGLGEAVLSAYDARIDHRRMVAAMNARGGASGTTFDALRGAALDRREFSHYRIESADPDLAQALAAVGFGT